MPILKKSQDTYYCFNEKGECHLPSKSEVLKLQESGIKPVAFLDSNVCLNIFKLVDFGKKATNCNRRKVLHLKNEISKSGLHISGMFGIMELCEKDGEFLNDKYRDFKYRLDFFEQIPAKALNTGNYDFNRDFHLFKDLPLFLTKDSWYEKLPVLQLSYASLLKIRELAVITTKKQSAEKNIEIFTDWMSEELGLMLGIEFKLAMSVFGGRTEFRKMIGLDDAGSKAKKKVKGTLWDIFHSRYCMHNANISKHLGEAISAYFVTNDYNLFSLLSKYSLTGVLDPGDDSGSTSWYNTDFDYPHLKRDFLEKHTERMLNLMYDRLNIDFEYNKEKVRKTIKILESLNGLS